MAIDRLKKEDKQILERGGNYPVGQPGYDWPPFLSGTPGVHDYIECHIYNDSGEHLIDSFITKDYEIKNNRIISKPGNDLRSKGYIRGKYHVKYNFLREEFGTNETVLVYATNNEVYTGPKRMFPDEADKPWYIDDDNLIYAGIKGRDTNRKELLIKDLSAWVHKISDDRREIRLIPNDIASSRYKTSFNSLSKVIQRWNSPGPSTEEARISFKDGFGGTKIQIDGVKRWKRHTKRSVGGEFILPRGFITHIERRVYEIERYDPRVYPPTILNEMPLPNEPLIPYEQQTIPSVIKEMPLYLPSKPEPGGFDFVARMIGTVDNDGFSGNTTNQVESQTETQTAVEIRETIEQDLNNNEYGARPFKLDDYGRR